MNETRRGWIAGLLGLFGIGIASKVEAVQAKIAPSEIDIPFIAPDPDHAADYVHLMLGFPVVKVELEQANYMWAYDETRHFFEDMKRANKLVHVNGAVDHAFKEIMLAKAQIMLGHIRNKFAPLPNGCALDGQALIGEGTQKLQYWYDRLEAVPAKPKLEGFIVFHVNVGTLPPYKAEAMVERIKEQWKKRGKSELTTNWQTIWIPTRTQDTEAYFYPLNGNMDANGRLEDIQGFFYEEMADSDCCPDCGSIDVLPIEYGYPDKAMLERNAQNKCSLGGCVISKDSPSKHCKSCGEKFGNYVDETKVVT